MNQTARVGGIVGGLEEFWTLGSFKKTKQNIKYRIKHLITKLLINTKPTTDGETYLTESERHAHKDSLSLILCVYGGSCYE